MTAGEPYMEGLHRPPPRLRAHAGRPAPSCRPRPSGSSTRRSHRVTPAALDREGGAAVIRERLVGLALHAYPRDVPGDARRRDDEHGPRRRRGPPPGPASSPASSASGLRSRRRPTPRGSAPPRLVADGFCLAAVWQMTLDPSTLLAQRARGMDDPLLAWPSIAAARGRIWRLALVGYDRLARDRPAGVDGGPLPGSCSITTPPPATMLAALGAPDPLASACWRSPRVAAGRDVRRLAWLAGAADARRGRSARRPVRAVRRCWWGSWRSRRCSSSSSPSLCCRPTRAW